MSLHRHRGLRSRSSRSADEEEGGSGDHRNQDDVPTPRSECSSMDISSSAAGGPPGGGGSLCSDSDRMSEDRSRSHLHSRGGDGGGPPQSHGHRPRSHRDGGHHSRVHHPPSGPNVDRRDEFRRISRCASVATSVLSLDADEVDVPDAAGTDDVLAAVERVREETVRELDEESAEAAAVPAAAPAAAKGPAIGATAAVAEEGEEKKEKDDDAAGAEAEAEAPSPLLRPSSRARSRSLTIRLSAEEERLFDVMVSAAEAYERGEIRIDESLFRNAANSNGSSGGGAQSESADGARPGGSCSPVPEEGVVKEDGDKNGSGSQKKKQTEIRVAGGWVRDKILDMHSHDVDISLDCMSGVQFATIVKEHLLALEREGKIPHPVKHHKIGVINANPSQSKHLETATMRIFNIEVDFVNLRAEEVYESDSRIPTQSTKQFGTPLEDALRRDFTINSLFYNVRTRRVEDWTERGIDDLLHRRLIVTPLDPHVTFRDDPLRVLRAIRFAVRYNMDLADDIVAAATSSAVHGALHRKVSRERVGKELEGMMSGKGARPDRALDLINELRLAGSVFTFPPGADSNVSGTVLGRKYDEGSPEELAGVRERGWAEATELIRTLPRALESHRDELLGEEEETAECDRDVLDKEGIVPLPAPLSPRRRLQSFSMFASVDVRTLHLATFLLPFRDLTFPDKKGKIQTVPCHMIRDGVKFKNRDITAMGRLLANMDKMRELMYGLKELQRRAAERREHGEQHHHHEEQEFATDAVAFMQPRLCRLEVGLFLREIKELWVTCLLLATVVEMREAESSLSGGVATSTSGSAFDTAEEAMHISRDFYRSVRTQGLDGVWKIRPLLNGREIMSILDIPKGPSVAFYVEEQIKWMLLNPSGMKEECEAYLRRVKRKREMEEEHRRRQHHGEEQDEQNEVFVGVSDGGQSSPVLSSRGSTEEAAERHFSKRMHVESVDLLPPKL